MNLLSEFERFKKSLNTENAQRPYRQAGYDFALKNGLPTRKNEEWHYTSVKSIGETAYAPAVALSQRILQSDLQPFLNPDFTSIVFVNGFYHKELSQELPLGVTLKEVTEVSLEFADTFEALNSAYTSAPYFLEVASAVSVQKPLQFVFLTMDSEVSLPMISPRLNIKVGSRSSVKFIESYQGKTAQSYFVNSVTDLQIAESAKVTYVRLQAENLTAHNVGRTRIQVAAGAQLESLAFATGAKLSRHTLEVHLRGKGSHSEILGIYAVQGDQHVDNTSLIDFAVGECDSNQLYKGILDGSSKAVFCGKVLIQKDAQKANSAQLNNNLLLSKKAEADSKPSLEIYADDVKAAHGSTVGQLNPEELFYLQSRAIPRSKAIPMLSYGYLSEVVFRISDESIQKWLTSHLDEAFKRLSVNGMQ